MLQWFLCDASGSVCLSVIEHVFVCVCVFTRGLTGKFVLKWSCVCVLCKISDECLPVGFTCAVRHLMERLTGWSEITTETHWFPWQAENRSKSLLQLLIKLLMICCLIVHRLTITAKSMLCFRITLCGTAAGLGRGPVIYNDERWRLIRLEIAKLTHQEKMKPFFLLTVYLSISFYLDVHLFSFCSWSFCYLYFHLLLFHYIIPNPFYFLPCNAKWFFWKN